MNAGGTGHGPPDLPVPPPAQNNTGQSAASACSSAQKIPACGACGYQKVGAHGKGHYSGQCSLVAGNVQCVSTLERGHAFYTGATCLDQHCDCKKPCATCRRPGHNQKTIALDPKLFKRVVTDKGVSFNKKGHKSLQAASYVCRASMPAYFAEEVTRARAAYVEADAERNRLACQRAGIVANLVDAVAPVGSVVSTLQTVGSAATALAPQNIAATVEQAALADAGLSAVASALGGAITATTGRPSGIIDDSAPAVALASLHGRQAEAERVGAKRLSASALSRSALSGSYRMYVDQRLF
eukprot:TRINITY_DN3722_c0_g1_i2.p1 TRINITY_DN3722_c0_g1~~TRINITY_DN3722_c0_g1_i2.p1  ORF type:complete len:298 (-),score=4.73 TRINITY_DN3722_c0_g1_i2:688-1581(-)